MRILIIDNYDSFTHNLSQAVRAACGAGTQVDVLRNNDPLLTVQNARHYDRIIISPGPGHPGDRARFGCCSAIIRRAGHIPILGVCLGMQGIATAFGGSVIRAREPMHGKSSTIAHTGGGIFSRVPGRFRGMRYHSLIVDPKRLPKCLEIIALSLEMYEEPMALRHRSRPIYGVQFHPESLFTNHGTTLIRNFLTHSFV